MEVEGKKILAKAGGSGRYQKILFILIIGYSLVVYYNTISIPYEKIRPYALCRETNSTDSFQLCDSEMYCDSNYEKQIQNEKSIYNWALDLQIDCYNEFKFDLLIMGIFFARFLSYLSLSVLADKFGRKKVIKWEVAGIVSALILILFWSNFYFIWFLWFLYAFCNHIGNLLLIYASEVMSQHYYSYVGMLLIWLFPYQG